MAESRIESARRDLVDVLEHLAHEDKSVVGEVEELEDDVQALQTLLSRLDPRTLGLPDIQKDLLAHLLDHVAGTITGLADEHANYREEILDAGSRLVDVLSRRFDAKMLPGARHCEALENVFDGFWRDVNGEEDEGDDPFAEGSGNTEELGQPDEQEGGVEGFEGLVPRLGRYRPFAKAAEAVPEAAVVSRRRSPMRRSQLPRAADVVGEVEIQGEE